MRVPDAILTSVTALLLVPVLFTLGAVFLLPLAVLFVPVIPLFALVGLVTLVRLISDMRITPDAMECGR